MQALVLQFLFKDVGMQRQLCAHKEHEAAISVSEGGTLPSEANRKKIWSRDTQGWEESQERVD